MKIRTIILCLLMVVCGMHGAQSETVLIVSDEFETLEGLVEFLQTEAGYSVQMAAEDSVPSNLSNMHAVMMYVHGLFPAESAQKLIDYAESGGRLVVLHHGISSKKKLTPSWLPFLGIHLDREEGSEKYYTWLKPVAYDFVNLQPKHYITSHRVTYTRIVEYESSDRPSAPGRFPAIEFAGSEIFINHQFTDGREKTVLFGYRYRDEKTGQVMMEDRNGWYKPAGKGWLFYFQPGDAATDFQNRNYCQILWNSLTWQP